MGDDLKQILARLPKLTLPELTQVKSRLSFLTGTEAKPKQQDWLLEGFARELLRRGLWASSGALPARVFPADWAAKAEVVRTHLLKGYNGNKPRAVELVALGALAGQVLSDYLVRAQVPLSPKTLLGAVEKVPLALEYAFPGYWAAGLLGFCIKSYGE